jgi:hypothetical protein
MTDRAPFALISTGLSSADVACASITLTMMIITFTSDAGRTRAS